MIGRQAGLLLEVVGASNSVESTSLIAGNFWALFPGVEPLLGVVVFVAGVLVGSYKSSSLARIIDIGDARRANEFKKLEEKLPEDEFTKLSAQNIVEAAINDDDTEVESLERYEDLIKSLHRSLFEDTDKEYTIHEKADHIEGNLEDLSIDPEVEPSLEGIISDIRYDENQLDVPKTELFIEFLVILSRYTRGSPDINEADMYDAFVKLGTNLHKNKKMKENYEDTISLLENKDHEANTLPEDPDWKSLYKSLESKPDYDFIKEVQTLVSILHLYEGELSALRSSYSDQTQQVDILEDLRENVNEVWLEQNVAAPDEDPLVAGAREGLLGIRIISTHARQLAEDQNEPDSDMLETLSEESPSNEQRIEQTLVESATELREYETIRLQLEDVDHSSLEDRIAQLEEDIDAMDSEVRSKVINEHKGQIVEELDRISPTNRLDVYVISKQIDYLEWAVDHLDKSADHGSLEDIVSKVDDKREKVDDMVSPGNYDINTGHNISREFVDLADEFHAQATKALDTGDGVRAEVLLMNSLQLLETVENLYKDVQLRKYLQHV